jgi:hypothetical protein
LQALDPLRPNNLTWSTSATTLNKNSSQVTECIATRTFQDGAEKDKKFILPVRQSAWWYLVVAVVLVVAVAAERAEDPAAVAVLAHRKAAPPRANADAASDESAVLDDAANDEAVLTRTPP